MLAGDEKRGQEILKKADQLCGHILDDCKDIRICNETVMIRAVIRLMQGRVNEVIEQLEELDQTQRMERTAEKFWWRERRCATGRHEPTGMSAICRMSRNIMDL